MGQGIGDFDSGLTKIQYLTIMAFHIDLRLDCHAQHEGEGDVKKHNHHDGDGKPDHEVLIALDFVRELTISSD